MSLQDSWRILISLSDEIAKGAGLLASAAVLGWVGGRYKGLGPVRLIAWWLGRVVLPLLDTRSFLRRMAVIFFNNSVVLASLIVLGKWRGVAAVGIAAVGITLGIAVRTLVRLNHGWHPPHRDAALGAYQKMRLGFALNMLEPIAIAICVGLALSQTSKGFSATEALQTFLIFCEPLLLAAAFGESLWLGAGFDRRPSPQVPARG